jgi:hypothetical protein
MTANEAYTIDPNAPPPPKFYPVLYRRLRLLKWLALVGGIVMLCGGAYEYWRGVQLQTTGKQTVGKLFSNNEVATGKGRTSYRVLLDYKPVDSATTFRKEFVVGKPLYDQIVQNGETTVTYAPSDPETSAVGAKLPINTEPLAIGAGLLLVSAGVWWYQRREWQKIYAYMTGG